MGVYIKGLKLPSAERQGELLILTDDGRCVDMFSGEYEAVELPPHGRLIDADKAKEHMDYICDAGGWLEPVTKAVNEYVKKHIDAEPTIIEAEEMNG